MSRAPKISAPSGRGSEKSTVEKLAYELPGHPVAGTHRPHGARLHVAPRLQALRARACTISRGILEPEAPDDLLPETAPLSSTIEMIEIAGERIDKEAECRHAHRLPHLSIAMTAER